MLRNGLVDAYRQGELAVVRRSLHLVEQILSLAEELALQLFLAQVVEGEGDFLIFIILIIIMVAQVALLLGSDDTAHEFHGRIILALVSAFLRFHDHFAQFMGIILEFHLNEVGLLVNLHGLGFVAQRAHGEHPCRMLLDGELTFSITRHADLVALVLHTCIRHRKAIIIDDPSRYLLLRHHLQGRNHEEDEHEIQFFNTFHYLNYI